MSRLHIPAVELNRLQPCAENAVRKLPLFWDYPFCVMVFLIVHLMVIRVPGKVMQQCNTHQLQRKQGAMEKVVLWFRWRKMSWQPILAVGKDQLLEECDRHQDFGTPELPCWSEWVELLFKRNLELDEVVQGRATRKELCTCKECYPVWCH